MKRLIAILVLVVFALPLQGQNYIDYIRQHKGQYLVLSGLLFTSGFCDGVTQTLDFHYWKFQKVFPKANRQFWDNSISWENKYKDVANGDYSARFWGSKDIFVLVTDGHHLTRAAMKSLMTAGAVIACNKGKKWLWYVYDFLILSAVRTAGFHLSYSIIF